MSIQGGYRGYNTASLDPDERVEITILSGDLGTNPGDADGPNFTNRSDNAYHVVLSPSGVTPPSQLATDPWDRANLDGFTIKGGESINGSSAGGGVKIVDSNPVIRACIITDNQASGVFCDECEDYPMIRNCTITGNQATIGGGIFTNSTCNAVNCTIVDNHAFSNGGGICLRKNAEGVAMGMNVVNCTVMHNTSDSVAGGISLDPYFYTGTGSIVNTLVANNSASTGGGVADFGGTTYLNSILWGNTASFLGPQIWSVASPADIEHCDVEGGTWGGTNINADPLFEDDVNGDYRLQCMSPCLNKGPNSSVPGDTYDVDENGQDDGDGQKTPDLDLEHRIVGLGSANLVDMGAYEKQIVPTCHADIAPLPCPNCVIDVDDLLYLINSWGECEDPTNCPADLIGTSNMVDVDDLLEVINNWGPCDGCTGDEEMPLSVEDCMEKCSNHCPGDEECWLDCVDDCVRALCEAEIIECDE